MSQRVLVAGVGNLFLSDDGFGPEVVRRLAATGRVPAHVRVVDYGIRGMHLAYDLLEEYDALVLVDAVPGKGPTRRVTGDPTADPAGDPTGGAPGDPTGGLAGDPTGEPAGDPTGGLTGEGAPGDLIVLEVREDDLGSGELDAHGMDPVAVLANLKRLGGTLPPTYVVGCRPYTVEEGIGLSAPVEAAIPAAMDAVLQLLATRVPAHTSPASVEPASRQEV